MPKIPILWCSNVPYSENHIGSGSWVVSIVNEIRNNTTHPYQLVLITKANIDAPRRTSWNEQKIVQIELPLKWVREFGKIHPKAYETYHELVHEFEPQIIQIWGTEGPWVSLNREIQNIPKVVTIQGILNSLKPVWYKGLSFWDIVRSSIGVPDVYFFKTSALYQYLKFNKLSFWEQKQLNQVVYFMIQSNWVRGWVKALVDQLFKWWDTHKILRPEFYQASKWQLHPEKVFKVFVVLGNKPYKGSHVVFKAAALLKKQYGQKVHIRVAGLSPASSWYKQGGYEKLLFKYVADNELSDNVDFIGNVNAAQLVQELQQCDCFVQPSFVESYSLTLAEAMYLGVPSIASYAGAMPELAGQGTGALHFDSGDHTMLAHKINSLIEQPELRKQLSLKALELSKERHEPETVFQTQMKVYSDILNH